MSISLHLGIEAGTNEFATEETNVGNALFDNNSESADRQTDSELDR